MAQYFEVHPDNPQPRLLKQAAALLGQGGVLAVPTDSSYALVCQLDDKAAAALLDVSPGTLSVWRSTGRYNLPFLKIGRKVRYRRSALEAWMQARTRESGATA